MYIYMILFFKNVYMSQLGISGSRKTFYDEKSFWLSE